MSDSADQGPSARQDLIGGLVAVAFGLFAGYTASAYPMGSLLRMGPGFFPVGLAGLIVLLGLVLIVAAFRPRPQGQRIDVRLRPLLMIGLGVSLFALLLERAGLLPATLVLVLVSSLAESPWRPKRAVILAIAMTALVYLVFITALQMPITVIAL